METPARRDALSDWRAAAPAYASIAWRLISSKASSGTFTLAATLPTGSLSLCSCAYVPLHRTRSSRRLTSITAADLLEGATRSGLRRRKSPSGRTPAGCPVTVVVTTPDA